MVKRLAGDGPVLSNILIRVSILGATATRDMRAKELREMSGDPVPLSPWTRHPPLLSSCHDAGLACSDLKFNCDLWLETRTPGSE